MNQNKKQLNIYFALLFLLLWCEDTIFSYFVALFSKLPIFGILSPCLFPVFAIALFILSYRYITIKTKSIDVVILLAFLFLYFISSFWAPGNDYYILRDAKRILFGAIPMYFIGLSLDFESILTTKSNYNLKKCLTIISLLSVIISTIYLIYQKNVKVVVSNNDGNIAYIVLLSLIVFCIYCFTKSKILSIISVFSGFVILLSYGNRGSVLCFMAFVALYLMFCVKKSKSIRILVIALVAFIFAYNAGWINLLLNWLESFVSNTLGFSSRIFDFLDLSGQGNTWDSDADRVRIFNIAKEAIFNRPLLGYGILGDRPLIGGYVHNIIYELWIDFGVISGTICFIVICAIIVKGIISTKQNSFERAFIIALISVTLVQFFIAVHCGYQEIFIC